MCVEEVLVDRTHLLACGLVPMYKYTHTLWGTGTVVLFSDVICVTAIKLI